MGGFRKGEKRWNENALLLLEMLGFAISSVECYIYQPTSGFDQGPRQQGSQDSTESIITRNENMALG
jgi:hypothetical protein